MRRVTGCDSIRASRTGARWVGFPLVRWRLDPNAYAWTTPGHARKYAIAAFAAVTIILSGQRGLAMRQPLARTSRGLSTHRGPTARPRPAHHPMGLRPACGHARYTKGCDICALAGIYQDHLSRQASRPPSAPRSSGSTWPATRPACSNCGRHGNAKTADEQRNSPPRPMSQSKEGGRQLRAVHQKDDHSWWSPVCSDRSLIRSSCWAAALA